MIEGDFLENIININENSVKFLRGKIIKQNIEVLEIDKEEIEQIEQIEQVMEQFTEKYKLKGKKVKVVLSDKNILYREIKIPVVKNIKQLTTSVINEMMYYNTNIDDYTVDFIKNDLVESGGLENYFVYAIKNKQIELVLNLLDQNNIKCKSIDIDSNCIGKLLKMIYPQEIAQVVVSVNRKNIELYIIEDGKCVLSRRTGIKYENFKNETKIISEELIEQIRKLMQFHTTRHMGYKLNNIVLIGDILKSQLEVINSNIINEIPYITTDTINCRVFSYEDKLKLKDDINEKIDEILAGALIHRSKNKKK